MMAKPMKTLALYYSTIKLLIIFKAFELEELPISFDDSVRLFRDVKPPKAAGNTLSLLLERSKVRNDVPNRKSWGGT